MGFLKSSAAEKFVKHLDKSCKAFNIYMNPQPLQDAFEQSQRLDRDDQYQAVHIMLKTMAKHVRNANNTDFGGRGGMVWDEKNGQRFSFQMHLINKMLPAISPTAEESAVLIHLTLDCGLPYMDFTPYLRALVTPNLKDWANRSNSAELCDAMRRLVRGLKEFDYDKEIKYAFDIEHVITDGCVVPIEQGESWTDQALADLDALDTAERAQLLNILNHARSATGSKPSKKWLKQAQDRIDCYALSNLNHALLRWFPLVDKPRTIPLGPNVRGVTEPHADQLIRSAHSDVLKGLCWMAGNNEDEEVARALGALALTCYKKIPGVGPRAVKIGNAAVYALGVMPGRAAIGQLAILRIKLKFASAQKLIIKALDTVAQREGIPRDQIEEMAVPGYGLESVGFCEQELGEYAARVSVSSAGNASPCKLVWVNPKGKEIKSVPAAIKRDFPEELKELKASVKDINKMLPVQRDRIDGLFLERKSWPMNLWRERYLDHPLIGTIARRMIWVFTHGKEHTAAAWLPDQEQLVQVNGDEFIPDDDATVSLWHPIHEDVEDGQNPLRIDVLDWRKFYEERGIVQPFKQAHREVYLLTDAERNTDIYSNRFAAHILRQHQFNALCIGRFWKNQLRIMADMECHPPRRDLSAWGLRSEFWVEGVGDDYNEELVSESGAFLYLATDQVRFYAIESAQNIGHVWGGQYQNEGEADDENHPISLQHIPPIVLSEILRDVDLFVGVSSVGNNPEWADGGPEGQFRDYWHTYSFGALSGTAQTRRELLERLVPRLKIASQCEVGAKFLTVRGNVRTYKIHLGSGNILMEPNDQYLCIVPTSAMSKGPNGQKVHLPFEGDRVLAIILSKAFLLADDHKVKDKTILTQIHHK